MADRDGDSVESESKLASFAPFDVKAEARLRRKLDWVLLPILCLIYISAFVDRINIGNARLAGLETELNLQGYDYNVALSAFFISYILFEIPMLLACKAIGPAKVLPACTFFFGLFSMCTAFVKNYGQLVGLRFLLGIPESPMLPGIAYYLSRFYRKDELVFRLGLYVVCAPLGGMFGGLLATGLQRLDGIGPLHSWQQIFFVEGIITMGLGIIAYFLIPARPETARFLSDDEKRLAIDRIVSEQLDNPVYLDKIKKNRVLHGIFEIQTLVSAFLFLLNNITVQGAAIFTPTIVASIFPKLSSVQKQLRTAPPYAAGALSVIVLPYLSYKTKRRGIFLAFEGILMIVGYAMNIGSHDKYTRYGASFVIMAGAFPFASILNAWMSANSVTDAGRAASIATIAMFGNIGGLISTWSYLPKDSSNYHIGNSLNLGTSSGIFVIVLGLLAWMHWQNRRRDTQQVSIAELEKTSDDDLGLGRAHPEYRYRY